MAGDGERWRGRGPARCAPRRCERRREKATERRPSEGVGDLARWRTCSVCAWKKRCLTDASAPPLSYGKMRTQDKQGHGRSWKVMEGHVQVRSCKVMEGHGASSRVVEGGEILGDLGRYRSWEILGDDDLGRSWEMTHLLPLEDDTESRRRVDNATCRGVEEVWRDDRGDRIDLLVLACRGHQEGEEAIEGSR